MDIQVDNGCKVQLNNGCKIQVDNGWKVQVDAMDVKYRQTQWMESIGIQCKVKYMKMSVSIGR